MIKYTWTSQGDYYTFRAEQAVASIDMAKLNEHLVQLHDWLKDQKLKLQGRPDWDLAQSPNNYRLVVERSLMTETVYQFDISNGQVVWEPSTEMHPQKVKVQLVLHERHAFMFRIAFDVSDDRQKAPHQAISQRRLRTVSSSY